MLSDLIEAVLAPHMPPTGFTAALVDLYGNELRGNGYKRVPFDASKITVFPTATGPWPAFDTVTVYRNGIPDFILRLRYTVEVEMGRNFSLDVALWNGGIRGIA